MLISRYIRINVIYASIHCYVMLLFLLLLLLLLLSINFL